jgi:hypothetical protein
VASVPDEEAAFALRQAIRVAVEREVSAALAWQREAEARIARAELDLAALRTSEEARARAAVPARVVQEVATPRAPDVSAAVAPPALPVPHAPQQVATYASIPVRFSIPSTEEVPFDIGMLPDELNGGRRKRALVVGALLLFLVILGTLVAFAIASQAKHGL